jgi:hypothetical protein
MLPMGQAWRQAAGRDPVGGFTMEDEMVDDYC